MLSLETLIAYCRTSYRVFAFDRSFVLRIAQRHPPFDEWLAAMGVRQWMLITAWNPRSTVLSSAENAARHRRLLERAAELRAPVWNSAGAGDDPAWPAEEGLCLGNVDISTALALGREFGQHAVVTASAGEPAELQFPFLHEVNEALVLAIQCEDRAAQWVADRSRGERPQT